MTADAAVAILQRSLMIAVMLAAPMLLFGLVTGLLISILQAVTQVQEMTLTFIPKMLAIAAAMIIFGQWILLTIIAHARDVFQMLPQVAP